MRVLWVNEAADFVGGCEQYIFNTVRILHDHGVQSSLLYDCQHRLSPAFVKPFEHAFPMVDIKTQVAEIKPDLIYIHRLSGKALIEQLRAIGVPVVRFFHDYQLFCPREHRYSALSLKTCRKPIGARCYFPCLGVLNRTNSRLGFRINYVHKLRAAITVNKKLDAFIVGSHYMAQLIAAHGFVPERTHVIPLYSLAPPSTLNEACEPGLFFFAGQLIRSKGLDTLLQAMTRTKQPCRLVIAGQGRQEAMFRDMAQSLGLAERVIFLGQIPHDELARWYAKAVCLVVPSRYPETFGLIGPEAMRYGTAVIGTKVGAIEEWLQDGITGLAVPPNDSEALAKAMDWIAENPQRASEMGVSGKKRYEEHFQPENHINELLSLFRSFNGGRR